MRAAANIFAAALLIYYTYWNFAMTVMFCITVLAYISVTYIIYLMSAYPLKGLLNYLFL